MKKILFISLAVAALESSCKKTESIAPINTLAANEISTVKDSIYKGAKVQVFGGKAWCWLKTDSKGIPKQLAITITDAVLNTLPDSSEGENENVLPGPPGVNKTVFKDFALDWSPQGHLPENIYDKPLFDFHFYTITEAERQAILIDSNYYQNFRTYPFARYLPQNYGLINAGGIPGGGCRTGTHWYDTIAPEFYGQPFTQTFVYGTYNGKVNFYDPMMTLDFLKSTNSFERSIPQPANFMVNGYYPSKLRVQKHDAVTDIILEKFVLKPAS